MAHVLNYSPAGMIDPLAHPGAVLWGFAANGHFAVLIFFTISGFVLSYPYFVGGKTGHDLALDALNRMPRLMIPVFITGMLCYGIQAFSDEITGGVQLAPFSSPGWIERWDVEGWSFVRTAQFLLTQVFFGYSEAETINVNLWTMPIEFAFSFFVFGIVALTLSRIRFAGLLVCIGIVGILSWRADAIEYLLKGLAGSTFFLGIGIAYYLDHIRAAVGRWPGLPYVLMIGGLALSSVLLRDDLHYLMVNLLGLGAAALFFTGFVCAARLRAGLDGTGWRVLGELSFALYLIHGSVLYLVFQGIAAHADPYGIPGFIIGMLVAIGLSLVLSFGIARHIEIPVIGWMRFYLRQGLRRAQAS